VTAVLREAEPLFFGYNVRLVFVGGCAIDWVSNSIEEVYEGVNCEMRNE
jgi:hypothetical protein